MTKRRVLKTHLPLNLLPTEVLSKNSHKMIFVCRNPKDAVVSQYHYFKNVHGFYGSMEDMFDVYLSGDILYGSYFQYLDEYVALSKVTKNMLLVTYEDMVTDMPNVIKQIVEFLGITLSEVDIMKVAEYVHFDQMKNRKSCNNQELVDEKILQTGRTSTYKFLRKGKKDTYKMEMPEKYIVKFNEEMSKWKGVMELYPNYWDEGVRSASAGRTEVYWHH